MENELKIWGEEKPDEGKFFNVYERYSEEPVLCEMQVCGPEQSTHGLDVDTGPCGNGGTITSDLEIEDDTRWAYVPDPPDWDAIAKEGES